MVVAAVTILEQHVAILAPILGAIAAVLVAIRSLSKRTNEIKVLVNGRLDEALQRIRELEAALGIEPGQTVRGGGG